MPESCCSITCTTVLCKVSRGTWVEVPLMAIEGGAILGYCAIGKVESPRRLPA
jgi:hypothetical protein